MKRINEIVVVEGKTDSQLLKELYDVDTIETHGLGLDDKTLELIKEASKTRGVIVLNGRLIASDHLINALIHCSGNSPILWRSPPGCILPKRSVQ